MLNEKSEICFIAPTAGLAQRAKNMIQEQGLNILVYTAALESAVTLANNLMKKGIWLFISRRGTRAILEKELNVSVVDMPLEASDYIPTIQNIRTTQGGLIAFFSTEDISNDLETICYLLNINIKLYSFYDNASCEQCVKQAVKDGAICSIGGGVSEAYARKEGLVHYLVESSDHTIQKALDTACQLYELQHENTLQQERLEIQLERYRNIFNYTHDAIIAVDGNGRIEIINKVAEKLIGTTKRPFEGKPIEEILVNTNIREVLKNGIAEVDQLMNINNTMISTNRVPIIVNGEIKGVVATFQEVQSLQNTERSIRIKLHEKGLSAKYRFSNIIGESDEINNAKELAESFADSEFTIMLYGETGTGKEIFAQSIHNESPRNNGPFVAVNCTALSKSLLESELFGYADSSFTGAKKGGKAGLFEIAHGGTIFLDEIGELPLEFQAQFLRVLQEKELRRVGGDSVIPVDIRVIGATNKNLLELVEEGKFRRDLFYRLNVLNVNIPPLRERKNDYLYIADLIYKKNFSGATEEEHKSFQRILERYRGYFWPGNVRELNNIVERICLLQMRSYSENRIIEMLEKMQILLPQKESFADYETKIEKENKQLEHIECNNMDEIKIKHILKTLEKNEGNISATAKELRMSRSTIYRLIHKN